MMALFYNSEMGAIWQTIGRSNHKVTVAIKSPDHSTSYQFELDMTGAAEAWKNVSTCALE
jgi:hypothetical protein